MTFIENSAAVATDAMQGVNPILVEKYTELIKFLKLNPLAASSLRGRNSLNIGSEEYIRIQASNYAKSRLPRKPEPPSTVPDEMVSVILEGYFGISNHRLEQAKIDHSLSMAAENIVGDLLERYLATVMEPRGWIWCSGSMVKAVDFLKPPTYQGEVWTLLQVKNRDNSENSSSAAIRNGTDIKKWFRTFSKKEGSNWSRFPDDSILPLVSEEGFRQFVRDYLTSLRK